MTPYTRKKIIGDCTLYLGDCLDIMPTLGKVDAVVTDPPYGTTQCKWDAVIPPRQMWEKISNITTPNSAIILMSSQPFTTTLISSNPSMFKYVWVWEKNLKTGNLNARKRPMGGHEDIVVFYEKQPTYNPQKRVRTTEARAGNTKNSKTPVYGAQKETYRDRQSEMINPDTVIRGIKCVHNSSGKLISTQKPVALMEYLIKTYTNIGDTVLDFAIGSGTTGVACINTKRKFIGIDNKEEHFDIACERISRAERQGDLFRKPAGSQAVLFEGS